MGMDIVYECIESVLGIQDISVVKSWDVVDLDSALELGSLGNGRWSVGLALH